MNLRQYVGECCRYLGLVSAIGIIILGMYIVFMGIIPKTYHTEVSSILPWLIAAGISTTLFALGSHIFRAQKSTH